MRPTQYKRPVQQGETRGGWYIAQLLPDGKYLAGCPECGRCAPRSLTQLDRTSRCKRCMKVARRQGKPGSVTR